MEPLFLWTGLAISQGIPYNDTITVEKEKIAMKYDFTSILDRRGKDAIAIDMVGAPGSQYPAPREVDVIPLWVADMNFPVVLRSSRPIRRAEHPARYFFLRRSTTMHHPLAGGT